MKYYPILMLRCQFEVVETGDDVTAVSIGDDADTYNGVVVLKNESTRFMFEKLQEGITLPELIRACMEKYADSSVEEVGPEVMAFLEKLREKELLVADTTRGIKVED